MRTIVVFYHARNSLPLRSSNEAHLLCWHRYSRQRTLYVNVAFEVPWWLLRHLTIDAVIFDTIFFVMHWQPAYFTARATQCLAVKDLHCPKVAVVQDEFLHMDVVNSFLRDIGITDVLTCSEPSDWPTIYPLLDPETTRLRTVLTGYVDERRLADINERKQPVRDIDIGYRAWNNPYWLGEHGTLKVAIGQKIGEVARRRGFCLDIDNPTQFLIGEKWFDFLRRCRTVLGVEGGASIFDYDGSIKLRVESHLAEHPDASFEDTRAVCFPEDDHRINLACLSPRHFEAAMTRTCQVLLKGDYNGVFKPWLHYIPVERDYSNIDSVLDAIADHALVEKIADQAYRDIVASGRWSYAAFVRDIEASVIEAAQVKAREHLKIVEIVTYHLLHVWDRLSWCFIHLEVSENKTLVFGLRVLRGLYRRFRRGFAKLRWAGRGLLRLPASKV
jgi:hypothetical protein